MGFKRVWPTTGVVALTGALLLGSATSASADYIRDKQWPLTAFNAKKVWTVSQGQGVTVAVVDSGVVGTHPDLTGQVLPGKDFTGAGNPNEDTLGHGTSMAGIIAAHGHGAGNADGVMGLAPKAKILPVRVTTPDNDNPETNWAPAVRYAVDAGAKVINLSFAASNGSSTSKGAEAIAYAQQHDVVVVAGAGNDGIDNIGFPASLPGVVSVGAVDESLKVGNDSNWGKGLVLTAPGVKNIVVAPNQPNGYAEATGTSDSTAYVSAEAALLRAKFPNLTAGQIINRMIKSATYGDNAVSKKPDEKLGYGMIRPYSALTMDIPAGPKEGPLAQSPVASKSAANPEKSDTPKKDSSSSSSDDSSSVSPIAIVAGIAVVVVIAIIVVVIIRRRNRGGPGGPGGGTPAQGYGGYPNQPQYPANAPGQAPQNPPYAQQPPYQGQ
ncbi:type VII secretion-associated serine protease mycosin [Streptomyces sp. NBC_01465]|uniref:type VII secretion-associated serine protease mycosin n=1 Tax=Streptomyces sp. NBC_01465 TaxID=2903878 RepID=UPI002E3616FD|nr:type VII secretion-associated serine protease mycosin [Streptomyces sp. NBC_01465]